MSQSQLIRVITPSWSSMQGEMHLYERAEQNSPWNLAKTPIPVVLGETGLAWGIGLHPPIKSPAKMEGDRKSPAGIFALGHAFGHGNGSFKIDYLHLKETTEAVDDPQSLYYNQIIDRSEIASPDWTSSEKMGKIDVYEWGITVEHNFPKPVPSAGSAIFLHLWKNCNSGTAGCTAMSRENMQVILNWLDKEKQPRIVQLPIEIYLEFRAEWNLP